ncbi:MAG: hypothetical protein ACYC7E_23000 [Armatimonadota bacterium]
MSTSRATSAPTLRETREARKQRLIAEYQALREAQQRGRKIDQQRYELVKDVLRNEYPASVTQLPAPATPARTGPLLYGQRYDTPLTDHMLTRAPLNAARTNAPVQQANSKEREARDEGDWLDKAANFSAGVGDSLTFGTTKVLRNIIADGMYGAGIYASPDDGVDTNSRWYKGGEATETGAEIVLTAGSGALKVAAKQAIKKAAAEAAKKAAAKAATKATAKGAAEATVQAIKQVTRSGQRIIRQEGQRMINTVRKELVKAGEYAEVHHKNALFGHPGGQKALFPTGGLPAVIHSSKANLQVIKKGAKDATKAAHRATHAHVAQLERVAARVVNPVITLGRVLNNTLHPSKYLSERLKNYQGSSSSSMKSLPPIPLPSSRRER